MRERRKRKKRLFLLSPAGAACALKARATRCSSWGACVVVGGKKERRRKREKKVRKKKEKGGEVANAMVFFFPQSEQTLFASSDCCCRLSVVGPLSFERIRETATDTRERACVELKTREQRRAEKKINAREPRWRDSRPSLERAFNSSPAVRPSQAGGQRDSPPSCRSGAAAT